MKKKFNTIFEEAYKIGNNLRSILESHIESVYELGLNDRNTTKKAISWYEAVADKAFDDGACGRREWSEIASYIPDYFEAYIITPKGKEALKEKGESLYWKVYDLGYNFERIHYGIIF